MGRIEEALAKLQQAERAGANSARRQLGKVISPSDSTPRDHAYGGKYIQFDMLELRRQGLIVPDDQQQRLVDQYRRVKRPLLANASRGHEPLLDRGNLIMVGSAFSGEGKTFTSINLSLSVAREQDWSVVLADGDSAKRHLTRLMGADAEPGLVDLLRDPTLAFESLVMPTNVPHLGFLPAGKRDEQAAELLASARMSALCAEISHSDSHRVVIFDSAPLLLTTESPVLASQCGQVLLVVLANRTPRQAVLDARDRLDPQKATNLLLNQADAGEDRGSYGDYYRYGE
jgi:exopolysaccharide/PEP-CTERM locus tyrosine autokinase